MGSSVCRTHVTWLSLLPTLLPLEKRLEFLSNARSFASSSFLPPPPSLSLPSFPWRSSPFLDRRSELDCVSQPGFRFKAGSFVSIRASRLFSPSSPTASSSDSRSFSSRNVAAQLKRGISRQFSMGSVRKSGRFSLSRQSSFDLKRALRFSFGRQSSLDPNRGADLSKEELTVPENLDATMQLLFMACKGDVKGVEDLLNEGVDVNSIDLDGRTALHIAACEGHADVVKLLLRWRANIDARDRWGSTAAVDAKYYGNAEIYKILKARGAKIPQTRKTPMVVSDPQEIPEYELNPSELHLRRGDVISKGIYQVAKWNGTKVAVKILDKDCYTDPGDLGTYLQKKGRLHLSKALKLALDIARHVLLCLKGNLLEVLRNFTCVYLAISYSPSPAAPLSLPLLCLNTIIAPLGSQLKIAGFGSIKLSKILPDKAQLDSPAQIDSSNLYTAPEVHKGEMFNRSVDAFSFGLILYEMIEGAPPFHPNSPEDATKMISLEGKRPPFKHKSKSYPADIKE
ncbi:hypothetical protein ACLOJK_008902 [Asimina triloba]